MTSKLVSSVFVVLSIALLASCQNHTEKPSDPVEVAQSDLSSARNPTIQHCQESGYQVLPVVEDGVTRSHFCLNAESGKKCDSWAFYRGECSLNN